MSDGLGPEAAPRAARGVEAPSAHCRAGRANHRLRSRRQVRAAVGVGEDLAQLFDAAQKLRPRLIGIRVARQHQLRDVADPAHRRGDLFGVDRVPQAQDVGIGRDDGEAARRSPFSITAPLISTRSFGASLRTRPLMPRRSPARRPRMTAGLISTSALGAAVPRRTLRVCAQGEFREIEDPGAQDFGQRVVGVGHIGGEHGPEPAVVGQCRDERAAKPHDRPLPASGGR